MKLKLLDNVDKYDKVITYIGELMRSGRIMSTGASHDFNAG